jgi:hypothetical protein
MKALAAAFALLAGDDPLSVAEYRARLASLVASIDGGDLDAARAGAGALLGRRVAHEGATFRTDRTVLLPLAEAGAMDAARSLRGRLAALLDALDALPTAASAPAPDPALLERLRREEAAADPSKGGLVGGPQLHRPDVPQSLLDRLRRIWEGIVQALERFLRWLVRFFLGAADGGGPSMGLLVGILMALILAVLVAGVLLRRRRALAARAAGVASSAPSAGVRDEDPLSRDANEWERFAADLMKAGRFREAIRAWYHALLVTLFRAGLLHYRKDRTNWEYAFALPPQEGWRPDFLEATREFEREWYGRRDAPAETAEAFAQRAQEILSTVRQGRRP